MATFNSNQQAKALAHIADAEKSLKKWSMFGTSTKYEDAAESFKKAGNCYKISQMWKEASEAYGKAAENYQLSKDDHETANAHLDAAKCLKNVSPGDAIESYLKVVDYFTEKGRLGQAGKLYKEMGEIFEADHNFIDAVTSYEHGANFHKSDNSPAAASACLVKVATIVSKEIDPPEYAKAARVFEELGRSCMEKKLLQANARNYWLQAGLCLLAMGDTVAARQKIEDFHLADYSFESSRESKFLQGLTEASEGYDVESFSQQCFDWDKLSKLDQWKTSILLAIKRSIQSGVDDAGGGRDDAEVDLT